MFRQLIFIVTLLMVSLTATAAQEVSVLTTPVTSTVLQYEILGMSFYRLPEWSLEIVYVDNLGKRLQDNHRSDEARDLIVALNKANLTTKSLERRLMEHLIAEGKIPPATITGTPR